MAQKRKSRPAPIRRYANDLVFKPEAEGEEYYPHYGEYIEFVPNVTVAQVIFSEREVSEKTNEELVEWVESRMVSWDWTDARGMPYGPPRRDALKKLSMLELMWILRAFNGQAGQETDEDPLAGESDTTSGSPALAILEADPLPVGS